MVSILPKEETIIDPLYEPLKLNRYELCPHLTMLSNVSHLRYGFSPYLLFDVEGWKEVVKVINDTDGDEEINTVLGCEDFPSKLEEYLKKLERLTVVDNTGRNDLYEGLKSDCDTIKAEYEQIKDRYQKFINNFLDNPDNFKENFGRIAQLFRLDYPVKLKFSGCGEEQFMCEEGKIYSMKEALLRTFELRRARWLQMSGSLHTIHRAATHTRLSHEIGSMIAGVNALREIDVYPVRDMSMSLGEYLLMRGELHEFLMANFLHDIGHSPLSHVLEPNPFIELDHEEITRNLIRGKKVEGDGEGRMDWYVAERYLLKMKAIKDFEYRFFENRCDSIYNVVGDENWTDEDRKAEFLTYLKNNKEILESEVVTVSEVLANFGVDKDRIVEILSGKMFCPECKHLSKIEIDKTGTVICEKCGEVGIEKEKFYDTQFLNKLIESEIDIDRMDHVKRDSVVCGLSLTSFRLLELLGSMSVVLPGSDAYGEIHNIGNNKKPFILISEDGLLYAMNLLIARKSVFNDILYSDENNWINGVVNQITALAVRYLPHITIVLPFITDQVLLQFYMDDLFIGTQIEKLNRLFHGKMDCSAYGNPMRYKLKDVAIITKDDLEKMYKGFEEINRKPEYEKLEFPVIVFYTNIKETKCPICGKGVLKRKKPNNYECINCKSEIEETTLNENTWIIKTPPEKENIYSIKNKKKCGSYQISKDRGGGYNVESTVEEWDDIFVYAKKFEKEYHPFQKLAANRYKGVARDRFPDKPCELDVRNLFYIWINSSESKKYWNDEIKREIGKIWGENHEDEFDNRFVDLNKMEVTG